MTTSPDDPISEIDVRSMTKEQLRAWYSRLEELGLTENINVGEFVKRKPLSLSISNGLSNHPEIAASVGMILSRWNAIEYFIASRIFPPLTGTGVIHSNKIVYALKNSSARLDVIEESGKHTLTDSYVLEMFLKTTNRIRKILKMRNYYAHCVYAVDENDKLIAFDPTDYFPSQKTFITKASVDADLEEFNGAFADLNATRVHILHWMETRERA